MRTHELTRRAFLRRSCGGVAGLAAGSLLGVPLPSLAALSYRNHQPDRMTYRRLGMTDMMVSTVALGGVLNNSNWGVNIDENPAPFEAVLERLLDLGVNYFDTSATPGGSPNLGPFGADYQSQDNYSWLCQGARRDKVFISTKVDVLDKTPETVAQALSLMQTDHIDLVFGHYVDHSAIGGWTGPGQYSKLTTCYDALDALGTGTVRYKGFTSHSPACCLDLLSRADVVERTDAIMGFCCPFDEWVYDNGTTISDWEPVYAKCVEQNVGFVAMKLLAGAVYPWHEWEPRNPDEPSRYRLNDMASGANAETPPRVQPFVDQGYTKLQGCIRWGLTSYTGVNTAVIGMRTLAHAEENTAAMNPNITRADVERMIIDRKRSTGQLYDTRGQQVRDRVRNYSYGL